MKDKVENIIKDIKSKKHKSYFLGRCEENSRKLAKRVYEEIDTKIYICKGGVQYPEEPEPDNLEQCRKDGIIHRWVEVETCKGILIADLSSEINGMYGEKYLEYYLPKEYKRMNRKEFNK